MVFSIEPRRIEDLRKAIEREYKGTVTKWVKKIEIPHINPKKSEYEVDVVLANGKIMR
ncbi:MAG: hypothetical protein ACK4NF_02495 [Planctomycetota bacterium]